MSHLTQVRGLKPRLNLPNDIKYLSHLTQVRGLKLSWIKTLNMRSKVAPYTGAWIETISDTCLIKKQIVAPYTGAWIETMWMGCPSIDITVAPYTGAWIETLHLHGCEVSDGMSHLTQVRGLKHCLTGM
jgi:hypothetical protein